MLDTGYILVHRSLLQWEWYDDVVTKAVFLHLLLTVNYEDKNWRGMVIHRGQRICSLSELSKETNISVRSIRTAISHLESTGEVTRQKNPKGTAITVVRYDWYQDSTRFLTNGRQATDTQATSDRQVLKEDKKKLKKEKEYSCAFARFWDLYPKKKSKGDALKAWDALNPDSELSAKILQKVAEAKTCPDWAREGGRYIPYPATWLRAMGWEDDCGSAVQSEDESEDSL